jgi:methionyl-tRNA formyltransferase
MTRAVVFAYHNVGVRCLSVLLEQGVDVRLLVTHEDNPSENIWFESVAALATKHGIRVVTPPTADAPELAAEVAATRPDIIFSFYYRHMLPMSVLALAPLGAYNMHGSLLPKYRGRVPINWAIIKGELETGATLHEMVAKPDAGRIAGQIAVPIGPDDTAAQVFERVTIAAGEVLSRALPGLINGTATLTPQNLADGNYFGGRTPQDGHINWGDSAQNIHNLVRAVAPPYPGAFTSINGEAVKVTQTRLAPAHLIHDQPPTLNIGNDMVIALCGDGRMLRILAAEIDGMAHNEIMLAVRIGIGSHRL